MNPTRFEQLELFYYSLPFLLFKTHQEKSRKVAVALADEPLTEPRKQYTKEIVNKFRRLSIDRMLSNVDVNVFNSSPLVPHICVSESGQH